MVTIMTGLSKRSGGGSTSSTKVDVTMQEQDVAQHTSHGGGFAAVLRGKLHVRLALDTRLLHCEFEVLGGRKRLGLVAVLHVEQDHEIIRVFR